MSQPAFIEHPDILVVGSGIMSANLCALLKRLDPALRIQVVEVTDDLAQESSHGWNNAGTGHAGLCELSYTPHPNPDGSVDISNAIKIFEQFEYSRHFWAHAVASGMIDRPGEFINPVPHLSFVHGEDQVRFLRARHAAMSRHHFFRGMEFTTDRATIASWAPLLLEGRDDVPVAATKIDDGTDVNFGALARKLLAWLARQPGCGIACHHRITDLTKSSSGWTATARDLSTGQSRLLTAKFVFVGAGGGSLPLLQKAGIPEALGLGGFPIGGQWLVCDDPALVARHQAKVYGQPLDAAPTMAAPHLDTRVLDGKKTILFGPFGVWTTKFLHQKGSLTDLPRSIRSDNFATLVKIGFRNFDLVRYLVQQGLQSMDDRMAVLRVFYPAAQSRDWRLIEAGIRVQTIARTEGRTGIVHYGTRIITSSDRSISALLGASPGASVSVHIVIDVIQQCFPALLASPEGRARLKEMIPVYDEDIQKPEASNRFSELHEKSGRLLNLA